MNYFDKEIQYIKHNSHIFSDDFLAVVLAAEEYKDDTPLTADILKEYGFVCEREKDEEKELDGIWYNGFNLCEDSYDGTFNFAVYVRATGCMKRGYSVSTVGRLKELYKGIKNQKLEKKVIEVENKL